MLPPMCRKPACRNWLVMSVISAAGGTQRVTAERAQDDAWDGAPVLDEGVELVTA